MDQDEVKVYKHAKKKEKKRKKERGQYQAS